jgi:hypothetical protein
MSMTVSINMPKTNTKRPMPPILAKMVSGVAPVTRYNVPGDGNCGYWCLQYAHVAIEGKTPTLEHMQENMKMALASVDALSTADQHYLESVELGAYFRHMGWKVNFGVVAQTTVKIPGKKQKRTYPIQTVNYQPENDVWMFFLLATNGVHYEILTNGNSPFFVAEDAFKLFISLGGDYPADDVDSCTQLAFLCEDDLHYF